MDEILNKYKNIELTPRWKLDDGTIVVGEEVDSDNRLIYVINDGITLSLRYANECHPIENLIPPKTEHIDIHK